MKHDDLPSIYRAADSLSNVYQKRFFRALLGYLAAIVAAATLSATPSNAMVASAQVFVLIVTLALSIFLFVVRPEQVWYSARAIAESAKTLCWRYVMRAEPFDSDDAASRERLLKTLRQLVEQNAQVAARFEAALDGQQITQVMESLRAAPFAIRLTAYSNDRIDAQLKWYAARSRENRYAGHLTFLCLIALNAVALLLALMRISFAEAKFWPTDTAVAIGAAILTWLQARRYSELASSYALAASDISLVREQLAQVTTDDYFSRFVGDAENAFSREHTQWLARRDV